MYVCVCVSFFLFDRPVDKHTNVHIQAVWRELKRESLEGERERKREKRINNKLFRFSARTTIKTKLAETVIMGINPTVLLEQLYFMSTFMVTASSLAFIHVRDRAFSQKTCRL